MSKYVKGSFIRSIGLYLGMMREIKPEKKRKIVPKSERTSKREKEIRHRQALGSSRPTATKKKRRQMVRESRRRNRK